MIFKNRNRGIHKIFPDYLTMISTWLHMSNNIDWKCVLLEYIIKQIIIWFHQVLGHPEDNRMRDIIHAGYFQQNLRSHIHKFIHEICQIHKLSGKRFGVLPERAVNTYSLKKVTVNLMNP